METKILNTGEPPGDPKIKEPWPENFVDWNRPGDLRLLDEFDSRLSEAEDERPLREFFVVHPHLLANIFEPHCCWLFPKPCLGTTYVPDFLYCDRDSSGFEWRLVELESPKMQATTEAGSISGHCHHAVEQIFDYRRWLHENASVVQKQYPNLGQDCHGLIVIGRQEKERTELEHEPLAEFRNQRIEIASYDSLLYQVRERMEFINRNWDRAAEIAERLKAERSMCK